MPGALRLGDELRDPALIVDEVMARHARPSRVSQSSAPSAGLHAGVVQDQHVRRLGPARRASQFGAGHHSVASGLSGAAVILVSSPSCRQKPAIRVPRQDHSSIGRTFAASHWMTGCRTVNREGYMPRSLAIWS